jgi:hypothetical protein
VPQPAAEETATQADAAEPPETATEPDILRPASAAADRTATDLDPAAFDAAVDEVAEELEFVGFRRPAPAEDPEPTWTEHWSLVDALDTEEDTEPTATDVGELAELEKAVTDLAEQVEADPLQEEPEADRTATDVAGLSALKDAVSDLADRVDAGDLDEDTPEEEEEPKDVTHSQIDVIRKHFGKRPAAQPSDETEAD